MIREQRLLYLNPRDLQPSRRNVRSDPGDLVGLAETIREHGVLQPLGVTREEDGYRIVYGNRRRDAAIVVGLDRVPCVEVGSVDEGEVLVQQVLENLQRLDLNDLDKARAFQAILDRLVLEGISHGEALDTLGRTLGLSVRQIQRYMRLTQLGDEVQGMIASGELGVTHGQHLVGLDSAARQASVAHLAVEEGLSAAELARLCSALQLNANIAPQTALEALRRGERVPVVQARPREELPGIGTAPAQEPSWEGDDDSAWADEEDSAGDEPPFGQERGYGAGEPVTHDGNRVRRLHSMDSFMDEVQRLAQCVQDGDLQRFLGDDEAGRIKVRLAARQLRFLSDAVNALADALDSA
jgi:ParB family chromosome partitioning protein